MTDEYSLKKSMDSLGVLVPIIKNKRTGHMIDGKHRWEIKPDAPVFEIDIPEELEPLARLAINNVRRNADEDTTEWKEILGGLGEKKPQDVADLTGLSIRTVYRHWPQELKDQKRSEAISEGMKAKLTGVSSSIKTQERLAVCEGCKTSRTGLLLWHGRLSLCPDCLEKASRTPEVFEHTASVKNGQAKMLARTPETKPQTTNQMSTWTHRSESMKVQHSQQEGDLLKELVGLGITPQTDREVSLKWTVPDGLYEKEKVCYYVHGPPHDKGKAMDRDDEIEAALKQLGWDVLVFRHGSGTVKEWAQEVKEALKF